MASTERGTADPVDDEVVDEVADSPAPGRNGGSRARASAKGATAKGGSAKRAPTKSGRRQHRTPEPDTGGDESGETGTGATGSGAYVLPEIVPATVDEPEEADVPVDHDHGTVPLPTIVPADEPETADRAPVTDEWAGGGAPLVVRTPARFDKPAALRGTGRRPRVRKVTRVVRHVDPWSTFKVGLIFSVVLYAVLLTAGVLLWNVALNTGTVDNVERWFTQFGWETFELKGGEIFHQAWIAGLFGVVGLTGLAVLVATLFNLVSDIVGGVRFTVLEEEVVERTTPLSNRFVVRRSPTSPPAATVVDDGTTSVEEPPG